KNKKKVGHNKTNFQKDEHALFSLLYVGRTRSFHCATATRFPSLSRRSRVSYAPVSKLVFHNQQKT
ncbi:hypothetical protein KZ309_24835, partial [Escherichia coli]|nr:hypothetical protein [Escherichia coli]